MSGTGADALGRKGNQGRVDNKFKEHLSNSILRLLISIALANAVDTILKSPTSSEAVANQNFQATNIQNITNATFTQAGLLHPQKGLRFVQMFLHLSPVKHQLHLRKLTLLV